MSTSHNAARHLRWIFSLPTLAAMHQPIQFTGWLDNIKGKNQTTQGPMLPTCSTYVPQEQQWGAMKLKRVLVHGCTSPETWQCIQQEGYGLQYAGFHNRRQYTVIHIH